MQMQSFDYDLIILGPSTAAIEAALLAAQDRSRVALVTLGLPWPIPLLSPRSALAAAGIDVIESSGAFLSHGAFEVPGRSRPLLSRAYLVALPAVPWVPPVLQGAGIPYGIPLDPLRLSGSPVAGESWTIWGNTPDSLGYAQQLVQRGCSVKLWREPSTQSALLDSLQVALEGQGVEVSIGKPQNLDFRSLSYTDRLLVAQGWQWAAVDLNLEALHPRLTFPLKVDRFLQSTLVPRLYGCGICLGGTASEEVARAEARTAVFNALYAPQRSLRYDRIPYRLLTTPLLTQVGWTPDTVQRHWLSSQYHVLQNAGFEDWEENPLIWPQLRVVLHRQGQILGADGLGYLASQAIEVIAVARQRRMSWTALLRSAPGGNVANLLLTLEHQRRLQNYAKGGWREAFFNWRRTGFV